MLTKTLLDELFDYNFDTGSLTNKVNRPPRAKIGQEAGSLVTDKSIGKVYRRIGINGKAYKAHRLIWVMVTGEWPDTIDHIDGDGLNNAWANLRSVTRQDNAKNLRKPSTNTSGVAGVSWHKGSKKWQTMLRINGKQTYLGSFENFDDAVAARRAAEIEYGFHENHGTDRPL